MFVMLAGVGYVFKTEVRFVNLNCMYCMYKIFCTIESYIIAVNGQKQKAII